VAPLSGYFTKQSPQNLNFKHSVRKDSNMVAIGSLLFCDSCGSLLPRLVPGENKDDMVKCDDCFQYTKDTSSKVITSRSKPSAFPSALRAKHSEVQAVNAEDLQVEAVISRECPECRRPEMFYHTKQLRSADEGTTVFYRCECGFKDVQNN
jgi:DNA-directed RNA polymerase I subunit RPA12